MDKFLTFRDFVGRLEDRLGRDLPGENAQFSMAPFRRQRISDIPKDKFEPRQSAVLILLFPGEESIRTLLIQRPEYEGVHSGQVSFPGGKYEESDLELSNTALREASEELGIDINGVRVLGPLTEIYITPSNFLVTPFIGICDNRPILAPDPREVGKVIETDLVSLGDLLRKGEKAIQHSDGYKIKTPYYDVEGLTVWGATAMMIAELNVIVAEITSS